MVTSGLVWPWLLAVVAVVALAVAGVAWLRRDRRRTGRTRWVASTADLDAIPEVRTALRRYVWLRALGAGMLAVCLACAAVLIARPMHQQTISERLGTRDIVICLDVSGSMVDYDAAVLNRFTELIENFRGERVGLSIFNSTSRTVFPLTDDYPIALDEIDEGARVLDGVSGGFFSTEALDAYERWTAGTINLGDDQASLIGDGLASCGLLFDQEDDTRSRSIILVTDNELLGDPVYSLAQAIDLTSERDITLFGLYGGPAALRGSALEIEFSSLIQDAGGHTWFADDADAINGILDEVVQQQTAVLDTDPEIRITDTPRTWFLGLVLALAGFWVLQWRVRS
ncbi:vWA domain-containing protein [Cellulomonas taurus]|uniref:vWA domain-containing protein n=1 Tax=Cellulomonas taurus TaxID=2729175 RepID=UPI00145C4697|nr:VWA domain-containing protein [Cellulomonas taurus]